MASFECSAHPTMILKIIRPYLFILILPFIRAFVQYVTIGKIKGTIYFELLAICFVSVAAFCGFKNIKIRIKDNRIIIEKGFFIKKRSVVDISCVSSILIKQNIFDSITKAVSCAINTEAGIPKNKDFKLKLYKSDANLLYLLVFGTENTQKAEFSPFDIVLLAASTSSAIMGLIIGLPIINKTEDLINVALSDALIKQLNNLTRNYDGYIPPIVNTITLIFIFAYVISFFVSFFEKIKFTLVLGKKCVNISSGLIIRRKIYFNKENINNICFEQKFFMRCLKKYSMQASIGGYGDNKGEKAILIPIARREVLEEYLIKQFNVLNYNKNKTSPIKSKTNLKRFLFIPTIIFIIVVAIYITITVLFHHFSHFALFFSVIMACVDVYYASICYHNFKYSEFCFEDAIMLSGSKKFTIREMYCHKNKVGVIKIYQNPADRRYNTCKLKVTIRSESADSIKIKFIDLNKVIEIINNAYNIKLDV